MAKQMWCEMREGVLCPKQCENCHKNNAKLRVAIEDEAGETMDLAYLCEECTASLAPWAGRVK